MKKIAIALVFVLTIELLPYKIYAGGVGTFFQYDTSWGESYSLSPASDSSSYDFTPPVAPFAPSYNTSSISEKLFSTSYDSSKVSLASYYDGDGNRSDYLTPPQDITVNSQNTEILSDTAGQYFYAKQTYSASEYPILSETTRTIDVKYIGNNQVSVTVTPKILQDDYAMVFERYGAVVAVYDGDRRNDYAGIYQNWDGAYYSSGSDGGLYLFADDALYKDGKTYFINWATSWNWSTISGGISDINSFINSTFNGGFAYSPYVKKISSQEISDSSAVSSIIRPLNSDIVFLTQSKCTSGSKDSWFTTKSWVDCNTYGLSADGRAGSANYHNEDSSFGGIFGGLVIVVATVALSIALPIPVAIPIGIAALSNLTDPVIQSASAPGALGTVESSNNLGVGSWTWWGGFKTEPTVYLQAPSIVELPDSIPISWASKDADSCVASGDWSGDKAVSNSFTTEYMSKPKGTYSFAITCSNAYGSASKTATVEVIRAPRCSFSADPSEIELPDASTLSWDCQYPNGGTSADSCSIDNGIGSVSNISGAVKVRPTKTTNFILTCVADVARSRQAQVNIKTFSPQYQEINPR